MKTSLGKEIDPKEIARVRWTVPDGRFYAIHMKNGNIHFTEHGRDGTEEIVKYAQDHKLFDGVTFFDPLNPPPSQEVA